MMVCPYDDERLLLDLAGRPLESDRLVCRPLGQRHLCATFPLPCDGLGRPGARYRLVGLGDQAASQ